MSLSSGLSPCWTMKRGSLQNSFPGFFIERREGSAISQGKREHSGNHQRRRSKRKAQMQRRRSLETPPKAR